MSNIAPAPFSLLSSWDSNESSHHLLYTFLLLYNFSFLFAFHASVWIFFIDLIFWFAHLVFSCVQEAVKFTDWYFNFSNSVFYFWNFHLFIVLNISFIRYNTYTIQFTLPKCTVQWCSVYPQSCVTINIILISEQFYKLREKSCIH